MKRSVVFKPPFVSFTMLRSVRSRFAMRFVCGVLCASMLMGCVGGLVVAEDLAKTDHAPLELGRRGFATWSPGAPDITKSELLAKWGEPYRVEVRGERELLSYKREIGFSGLVVFALIPIPLVFIPASRSSVAEFQSGILKHVYVYRGQFVAGKVCGIVMWDSGMGPGCVTED